MARRAEIDWIFARRYRLVGLAPGRHVIGRGYQDQTNTSAREESDRYSPIHIRKLLASVITPIVKSDGAGRFRLAVSPRVLPLELLGILLVYVGVVGPASAIAMEELD